MISLYLKLREYMRAIVHKCPTTPLLHPPLKELFMIRLMAHLLLSWAF